MPPAFRFLSTADFERLTSAERLTYLSDAMEEMERLKVPHDKRGWLNLSSQTPDPQQ